MSVSSEEQNVKLLSRKDIAKTYTTRGWRVFPVHYILDEPLNLPPSDFHGGLRCSCGKINCNSKNINPETGKLRESPGKHPVNVGWQDEATTDPDEIDVLWDDENYNIGIVTGESSGLLVPDIDVHGEGPNGFESIEEAEKELGPLPETYTVRTGGGGEHRYLVYPDDGREYRNRSGTEKSFMPGVDVRGEGGYILGAGSNHWSGGTYEVVNDAPVAKVPEAWRDRIFKDPTPVGDAEDLAKVPFREDAHEYLLKHRPRYAELWTGNGSGDNSTDAYELLRLVKDESFAFGIKHEEITPEDCKAHAVEFYAQRGATGKHPDSWFDREVVKLYGERKTTTPAPVVEDDDPPTLWMDGLFQKPRPIARRVVDPFLAEGSLGLLYGDRGAAKTYLTHRLCLSVATGRDFLGHSVRLPGRVAIIDGEMDDSEIQTRLKALGRGLGLDEAEIDDLENRVKVISRIDLLKQHNFIMPSLNDPAWRFRLLRTIEAEHNKDPFALISFDNLSSLVGGTENGSEDWDTMLDLLLHLRGIKAASLCVHHAGKNGRQRGTSRREDVLDYVMKIERLEHDSNNFRWLFEKRRSFSPKDTPVSTLALDVQTRVDKHGNQFPHRVTWDRIVDPQARVALVAEIYNDLLTNHMSGLDTPTTDDVHGVLMAPPYNLTISRATCGRDIAEARKKKLIP